MSDFIDLHCHWLPAIDDGARTLEEGRRMLELLKALGFGTVIATPHMRPGMFENEAVNIREHHASTAASLAGASELPATAVSSEHYFDDVVFARILAGEGVPYPGGRAILLEFYEVDFPPSIDRCFAQLLRRGLRPVMAHPERYRAVRRDPGILERLVDLGVACLLDTAALVGKYGASPERSARTLLERGLYHAACSDAHRPDDVDAVAGGMEWIRREYGDDEVTALFVDGPRLLLAGELPQT